jgi:microcystin-dependent protein
MRANLPMGGKKITGMAPGVDPTDAATVGQIGGAVSVPIGAVIDYWGATPPDGYLFCAGQEVSRSTYAALFAAIGTAAGAGNGSTTFNLPDYRGRTSAGRENMATPATTRLNALSSSTLGAAGGSQTHTLTTTEIPAHTHPVTDPGHKHSLVGASDGIFVRTGVEEEVPQSGGLGFTNDATTGITVGANTGGGAHNNVQPTIIVNKIIRAS